MSPDNIPGTNMWLIRQGERITGRTTQGRVSVDGPAYARVEEYEGLMSVKLQRKGQPDVTIEVDGNDFAAVVRKIG